MPSVHAPPPPRIGRASLAALLTILGGCGSGGSRSLPVSDRGEPIELVFGRSRIDRGHSDTRLLAASARGLGERRLPDREGIESGVRVHPDGNRVVFVRERRNGEPQSRELFVAALDGGIAETQLTADTAVDATPCWSPDGERILFVSDRGGQGPRLWTIAADGTGLRLFFDDGNPLADPDWSRTTDRVVFARGEPAAPGRSRLWTVDALGRVAVPLTDGTALADVEPHWSPDGARVAFRRRFDPARSQLARIDVATGTVTTLTDLDGEILLPRWTPDGTRLVFARAWPARGIVPPRLAVVGRDGGEPALLQLDKRYALSGLDVLPGFRPVPDGVPTPIDAPMRDAEVVNGFGRPSRGFLDLVLERDGASYGLATVPSDDAELAAVEFRVPLGVADLARLDAVTVRIVAGVPEGAAGDVLRVSVANLVDNRNDTLVERTPDGSLETIEFTFASLAHVDRDRRIRFALIAELPAGQPGELWIDHVAVRSVEVRATR